MEPGTTATIVTIGITVIVMAIFAGGLYILLRFTFPLFLLDENKNLPNLNDLYTQTARFATAQHDMNERLTELIADQQKLIDELKVRLDKLQEEK